MPFEFYPSYVYYLSVFVILVAISFLKKKRNITPWKYRELLYLFALLVFLFFVDFCYGKSNKEDSLWRFFISQLIYPLPLMYIFFILSKRKIKDIYFIVHNKEDILWGLGIGIIIGGISFLKILISKQTVLASCASYIGKGIPFFYIILPVVGIIGPLTEELIFRGILIPTLEERMKTVYALILSVILFCLLHGFFYKATMLVFIGLILGVLFIKRRTIIPGFIVHSMLNFSYFAAIQLVLLRKM